MTLKALVASYIIVGKRDGLGLWKLNGESSLRDRETHTGSVDGLAGKWVWWWVWGENLGAGLSVGSRVFYREGGVQGSWR